MLQLQYIKDHREECISRLKIKNVQNVEERIDEIIALDAERRALQVKADAVKATVEGPVTPECPASVLRLHPDAVVFCDEGAASKLSL